MELGELNIHIGDGNYSSKYPKNSEFIEDGVPFISASDFQGRVFIEAGMKHISKEQHAVLLKGHLKPRDILIVVRGNGCGKVGYVPEEYDDANINAQLALLRCDNQMVNSEYLYYLLSTSEYQNKLKALCSGSAQPQLPIKSLKKLQLELLSYDIQLKIANLAKQIDDKILNNNAINRNLSEQLQVVYQEYFTNETNGVLSDICEYSKARIEVEELTLESYYSTENMLPNKMGATVATSLPSTGKAPKCKKGDILISNIRPYFKKIVYCYEDAGCSSDVLCFAAKSDDLSPYLYATLYMDKFFDYMVAGSKGTKMPRGDKQQIMNYPVYVPSNEELRKFSDFAIDVLETINKNKIECHRLEEIRDSLLPKLMSGELDVSSIDI